MKLLTLFSLLTLKLLASDFDYYQKLFIVDEEYILTVNKLREKVLTAIGNDSQRKFTYNRKQAGTNLLRVYTFNGKGRKLGLLVSLWTKGAHGSTVVIQDLDQKGKVLKEINSSWDSQVIDKGSFLEIHIKGDRVDTEEVFKTEIIKFNKHLK